MMEQTIGTTLRLRREEKKLTLEQVSIETKIRINYLQAIETDQLSILPSLAQARGFIRLYASFLGLDPYALLESQTPEPTEPLVSDVPTPDTAKKIIEIDLKEKLDEVVKSSSERISDGLDDFKENLKTRVQKLTDKIPYQVIKKDDLVNGKLPTSEPVKTPPSATTVRSNPTYQAMYRSIGADLRKQRESLGLSLQDVERQTKIREIYLYTIEEGNLDDLPSTVQGRGMVSNYAAFMNLNPEGYLSRFADALQQKRLESLPESETGIPLPVTESKKPITGWRRLLTPQLIFSVSMFLVFFVMIIWGSFQLMSLGSSKNNQATAIPISDILLSSGTPSGDDVTVIPANSNGIGVVAFTPDLNLQGTLAAPADGTIQVVISVRRRAFMQVTVDGKEQFLGRAVPGNVYSYSGNSKITLVAGDASALQVYYNQNDLGVLGNFGQLVNMEFTATGSNDLTAAYTPTPTVTMQATLTPQPTTVLTNTPELPTQTITPFEPTTNP
jgi:cytoskeletal protein RodZ